MVESVPKARSARHQAAKAEPVARLRNVSVEEAGRRVGLDDVSLEVNGGEILGVAGVVGNGQDALARVVTGLIEPAGAPRPALGGRRVRAGGSRPRGTGVGAERSGQRDRPSPPGLRASAAWEARAEASRGLRREAARARPGEGGAHRHARIRIVGRKPEEAGARKGARPSVSGHRRPQPLSRAGHRCHRRRFASACWRRGTAGPASS